MVDVTSGDVYCDVCGHKIGNYLTDDYFKMIATKYCDGCGGKVKTQQRRDAVRAWRRRRKQERKDQEQTINEFAKMTAALIEKTKLIEEENERLKAELRR